MWNFLWTSDLFYDKLAIFKNDDLWELKIEDRAKIARRDFYLAKVEKKNFLVLSSGEKVFCSEEIPIGKEILVQVLQEERDEKLAEVTQKLEIEGKYLLYFPYEKGIHISKKIKKIEERERLKSIFSEFEVSGAYLIRTEAEGKEENVLKEEMSYLHGLWETIQKKAFQERIKGKLLQNRAWISEVVEKYAMEDWGFSYAEHFNELQYLTFFLSNYGKEVREYCGEVSLWKQKKLDEAIQKFCSSRVDLEEGVSLFFERTHACVTIDVNNFSTSIKRANEIAAREIPRQLRLRNWSGIIVVDFIDGFEKDKKNLLQILQENFVKERKEIQWGGFQNFYLCIFTKERKGQELEVFFQEENQNYQIQSLENELEFLLEVETRKMKIHGEKTLLQEWQKRTRCNIKNRVEVIEDTKEKYYKIFL